MDKLAQSIFKYRWVTIVTVILLTAFLGYQIKDLRINSDVISALPDDDPDAALFKEIGSKFGGNDMGMIILETDNIFKTEVLEHVQQLTDTLRMTDGISSVSSLTDIIDIKGDDYGIEIGKLVDEWDLPDTPEELEKLKQRVFSKDLYKGSIVSEDGTATLIIFTIQDEADIKSVANSIREKAESLNLPEKLYYIGSPMLVTYISELMYSDLLRLIPVAFILIAVVLYLSFNSKRGVILPLLTAAIAITWTLGTMVLFGYEMSMISNNIPIILLAVGSAYSIHVLNKINYYRETDGKRAIFLALTYIIIPVFLAALTTIIGFISFIFGAYLTIIKDFGIFTALGTFFTCLLSLFFVPAIISSLSLKKVKNVAKNKKKENSALSNYLLIPLTNLLHKHPKYILTTWSILILISIGGIFLIERSVDIQEYFKKDNPTRAAENIMINKFGGSKPIYVLFRGDMQSPEVLKLMIETEKYMEKSPDVVSTQSVADLIAEINNVMGEGYKIPDERDKIEQLWFLLDGNDIMPRFVTDELDEGIILSKFVSPDNKAKKVFANYMNAFIQNHSSEDCNIQITGMPFVDVTMDKSLLKSQMGSLSIAIFFVIILVGLIMRSLPKGIYATLPIIVAIVILFGVMGYAGISLNIATVLVASVALGIGIDYSIHVISYFNHSFKITGDLNKAIEDTIMISGRAIVINVFSVSGGFLVLLFSEMVPLQYFGLLIALSMVGSSLGALTLLPVILILVNRKKLIRS
ncbi:MAG: MMPL family transporter [Bacteroidales bacterium]|nr:MMPL family transporter [Bacteroidales bacterium]